MKLNLSVTTADGSIVFILLNRYSEEKECCLRFDEEEFTLKVRPYSIASGRIVRDSGKPVL